MSEKNENSEQSYMYCPFVRLCLFNYGYGLCRTSSCSLLNKRESVALLLFFGNFN